jgi:hypothetical protein
MRSVLGSRRTSLLPRPAVVHTEPAPVVTNWGDSPTETGRPVIFFEPGSILLRVPAPLFTTQTPSRPSATAAGASPVLISSLTSGPLLPPVSSTIRTTIAASTTTASAARRIETRLTCDPVDMWRPAAAGGAQPTSRYGAGGPTAPCGWLPAQALLRMR